MQMGFLGGLTVAGLILLAALTGVVVVKMTTAGTNRDIAVNAPETLSPFGAEAHAAVQPAAPALITSSPAVITNPITGAVQYGRNCDGAVTEAKTIGVLPRYAKMNEATPREGHAGENICSAVTLSAQWDVTFFSRCPGGGDSCPVLARVTQQGQYVVFQRD